MTQELSTLIKAGCCAVCAKMSMSYETGMMNQSPPCGGNYICGAAHKGLELGDATRVTCGSPWLCSGCPAFVLGDMGTRVLCDMTQLRGFNTGHVNYESYYQWIA